MHPYAALPARAFWRSAVSEVNVLDLTDVYRPRFAIDRSTRIATAGSCFAQHIGRKLREHDYTFVNVEPAPRLLPPPTRARFGYGVYSARYGNIYTARQLLQLFRRADGTLQPTDDHWVEDGRYFDPYRSTIEPDGFASLAELERIRAAHFRAVRSLLSSCDVFVFTLGLTEAWVNSADGAVYPVCPGTTHGTFDPARHSFVNFGFTETVADMNELIAHARAVNPRIKLLLTVSPVPLTATASGHHVLQASVASKSVLRAVCSELVDQHDDVDYFPAYELVASHPMRAVFFEPNLRSVSATGVDHVMGHFFAAHGEAPRARPRERVKPAARSGPRARVDDDVVCDDAILEEFSR